MCAHRTAHPLSSYLEAGQLNMKGLISNLAVALSYALVSASKNPLVNTNVNQNLAADLLLGGAATRQLQARNATTTLFSRIFNHFDTRQTVGRCGATAGGSRCPGNQCCSSFDWCGTEFE